MKTVENTSSSFLQSIIRQVERLIPLRQQLCALPMSEPPAPDSKTIVEGSWRDVEHVARVTDRGA